MLSVNVPQQHTFSLIPDQQHNQVNLHNINLLCSSLTPHTTAILVHITRNFLTQLPQLSFVWTLTKSIQKLQLAARVIVRTPSTHHITPISANSTFSKSPTISNANSSANPQGPPQPCLSDLHITTPSHTI